MKKTTIDKFKHYKIDYNMGLPLYFQLKNILLKMVKEQILLPGEMLPAEMTLCTLFNLSRTTVRQAIKELVEDGLFYRVKGRGTFVTHNKCYHRLSQNIPLHEIIEQEEKYKMKVLSMTLIPCDPAIASSLNLSSKDEVIYLNRLFSIHKEPIFHCDTYLPTTVIKNLFRYNLEDISLYTLLSQNPDTNISSMHQTIEALVPTNEDCLLLNIPKTTAIHLVHSISYNKYGIPLEYTISKFRGDINVMML